MIRFIFFNKKFLLHHKYLNDSLARIPKSTFRRLLVYIALFLYAHISKFSKKNQMQNNCNLFNDYKLKEFERDLSIRLNEKVIVFLVVWAADNYRERRYIWCKNNTGEVLFIKLGKGQVNSSQFSNEYNVQNKLQLDNFFLSNKKYTNTHFFELSKSVYAISSVCLISLNFKSLYKPWNELNVIFNPIRKETIKNVTFNFNNFPWLTSSLFPAKLHESLKSMSGSHSINLCFNHGDLGSENILYNERNEYHIIDLEQAGYDLPYLTDPLSVYLDSRSQNDVHSLWNKFSSYSEIDILLALCYLASNHFPPALSVINKRFS